MKRSLLDGGAASRLQIDVKFPAGTPVLGRAEAAASRPSIRKGRTLEALRLGAANWRLRPTGRRRRRRCRRARGGNCARYSRTKAGARGSTRRPPRRCSRADDATSRRVRLEWRSRGRAGGRLTRLLPHNMVAVVGSPRAATRCRLRGQHRRRRCATSDATLPPPVEPRRLSLSPCAGPARARRGEATRCRDRADSASSVEARDTRRSDERQRRRADVEAAKDARLQAPSTAAASASRRASHSRRVYDSRSPWKRRVEARRDATDGAAPRRAAPHRASFRPTGGPRPRRR